MPGIDRLYLDTNVFIAMAEGSDAVSTKLFELVGMQMPGLEFLVTSEISLAELLVQPLRTGNRPLLRLYDDWMVSGGWLTVGVVNRATLLGAAQARSRYPAIKLPDAIHLSTAFRFGCSHFLTADKRLPRSIEPSDGKDQTPLSVIGLDADTLDMILEQRAAL